MKRTALDRAREKWGRAEVVSNPPTPPPVGVAGMDDAWALEKLDDLLAGIRFAVLAGENIENLRPVAFAASKIYAYLRGEAWTPESAIALLRVP